MRKQKDISIAMKKINQERLKAIGKILRGLREKNKTPRSILGKAMGLKNNTQYFSNIERGITPPSVRALICYIKHAKIDKEYLANALSLEERKYLDKVFSLSQLELFT